jgi:hypothetical protein
MTDQQFTGHTIYGTLGGIITIVLVVNISAGDLLRTMVLAAVGAVVSLSVSHACNYWLRKWRK